MILPTLRQLQFLVALGETGSFSRAAEACHVTQPTLSAGIKELEDLFGVLLAERESRGATLTHAGEIAAARASALLADAHALVQAAGVALACWFACILHYCYRSYGSGAHARNVSLASHTCGA